MTRDFSKFMPEAAPPAARELSVLERLGWQGFLAAQVDADTLAATPPVRVVKAHRNGFSVQGEGISLKIPYGPEATVGDWLLYDEVLPTHSRVLERKSLFKRRAPGHDRAFQMIAANVDTAFVVTSCNMDFNVARLERYLALAFEAEVEPVILLTKPDLCEDPADYERQAAQISDRVPVVVLNAKSDAPVELLSPWCKPGQTVAFLGSSGVGKSTLVNAIFGAETAETGGIREDDSRGRHTTTSRELRFTPDGCGVLDTPGMRELQLAEAEGGIADLFDDLTELATQCKFNDCGHQVEPGCAIRAAVEAGDVDPARLERWMKLAAEDKFNSASLAQKRSDARAFGKMVKSAMKHKKKRKK